MPEAIKEVVTETPQAALKKENTPDKVVPSKEVKPAEASSGTLPADELPQKGKGEGAVAPDVEGESPEQGKSETLNDAPMDEGKVNSKKEEKNLSTDEKEPSAVESRALESKLENSNKDDVVEELKDQTSDESLSQESKQPSSEECQIDETKQASPEESKTELSSADAANGLESTDNPANSDDNAVSMEDSIKPDDSSEKVKENPVDERSSINSKQDESIDTKTEIKDKKEDRVKQDQTNTSMDSKIENKTAKEESVVSESNLSGGKSNTKPESKQEHEVAETNNAEKEETRKVQNETSADEKEQQEKKIPGTENKDEIAESMDASSSETSDNSQSAPVEKSTEEVAALPSQSLESNETDSGKPDAEVEEPTNETEAVIKDTSNEQEMTSCSGSSKEIDKEAAEELNRQVREGKALLLTNNYFSAADILGKACEVAGKLYGELANENAELYYLYGCAMLECAKNESDVLGEGVKEKDEVEDEDEADEEANGDEQMETEDNGEGEEEKMAVDDDKGMEGVNDSEQAVKENGHDDGKVDESTKENSEEEEDSSLKVAWEMFELAKIAFTRLGNDQRLADTYMKLGEVGIESGHKAALDDIKAALEIRKKSTVNQRVISETHFNLGLGYATFEMFDDAIEQFKISKSVLEAKIDSLLKVEEEKAKEEIKDIKELLPDLEEKIQDMVDSKVTKEKQTSNGEETPSLSASDSGESSKPVSNITHLVKRKRKLEDVASDLLPNTKQICTDKEDSEKPEK